MDEWNNGIMEWWNNGIMGKSLAVPNIPIFQHSIIPM
jgi:hypothetical protein